MPLEMYDCGFRKNLQCDYRTKLGEGSYGEVFKCVHKNPRTGNVEKYVIKHSTSKGGIDKEVEFAENMEKRCALNSSMILYTKYVIPIYKTNKRNTIALTYAQVLSKFKTDDTFRASLTLDSFLKIATELHDAVTHIHDKLNMIHNDIKPENIGILNGQVKLLDLGLARSRMEPLDLRGGTIGYNPPNKPYNNTIVVDMWAVGCTLFEMISRSHFSIFWADSPEELELVEFATAVIMEDLMDISGPALVFYLLGEQESLDLKEFEDTSVMGFHTAMLLEQLSKVRENYRRNLDSMVSEKAGKESSLRQDISNIIKKCFEYAFSDPLDGGSSNIPFLKVPVNMKASKNQF